MDYKILNRKAAGLKEHPVKIIQFGEGNFLRAFTNWIIDDLNRQGLYNGGIAVVQPRKKNKCIELNEQEGLYHVALSGIENGKKIDDIRLINSLNECINTYDAFDEFMKLAENDDLDLILSNTTEAGIEFQKEEIPENKPAITFPGKLTQLLLKIFERKGEVFNRGISIVPCELIENNGEELKKCIQQYADHWNLDMDFNRWINEKVVFHNSLVDRIVPGFPEGEIEEYWKRTGFRDKKLVTSESYYFWAIEGGGHIEKILHPQKSGQNIIITENIQPYRNLKVRVLNGAHTAMNAFCYLYGKRTVGEVMDDPFTSKFVENLLILEVAPVLDFDDEKKAEYIATTLDRFRNPGIKHKLSDIALNMVSKFRVRVLPSIVEYMEKFGKPPEYMVFSWAALILFYKGSWKGEDIPVNDSEEVVALFKEAWAREHIEEVVEFIMGMEELWGDFRATDELKQMMARIITDLTRIKHGLTRIGTD